MSTAFQFDAFQFDAFQIVSPVYVSPAFQPCAFQPDAFQSAPCPDEVILGGHAKIYGSSRKGRLRDEEWDKAVLKARALETQRLIQPAQSATNISAYVKSYNSVTNDIQALNSRTDLANYKLAVSDILDRKKALSEMQRQEEEVAIMMIMLCI